MLGTTLAVRAEAGEPASRFTGQVRASPGRFSGVTQRIAIVGPDWTSLVHLCGDLIGNILQSRHQVLCLAADDLLDPAGEHIRHLEELGAVCARYPLRSDGLHPLADRKSVGALKAKFLDWRPHVVLACQPKPMLLGAVAAKRARVPRVVALASDLGMELVGPATPGWGWRRLARAGFAASHAVICHNRADLQRVKQLSPLPATVAMHVAPGAGVDLQRFVPLPLPSVLRGFTFVMVAPFRREKGVIEFCAAARKVRADWPDTRFILAGPDGTGTDAVMPSELARYVDHVEVRGDHRDLRPLFEEAHAVVLPSWREGMSRTLLEALACGRPIITTDIPGCRETVDVRVNGLLIPPRDTDALAAAICNVIDRPELLASMARASRLKAERLFDVREVNALLRDALGLG